MSTVKADNFTWKTGEATAQVGSSVTGPQIVYGVAKAWVQFAGATAVRNGSFNISSITLNATGYNTIAFSTSMIDTNYSSLGSASPTSAGVLTTVHMFGTNGGSYHTAPLTSSYTIYTTNIGTTAQNDVYVNSAVFR